MREYNILPSMVILGISAFFHDSAAAIIRDGEVLAAAQEERFTRIKNDASFPVNAVKYCLDSSGYSMNELHAVVFYDKPFLKFERLLETYYAFAPKGLRSFLTSMPLWIKEKIFIKKNIRKALDAVEKTDWKKVKLLFPEHHLSHAASAFYPSPFRRAAILTIDGVGEWATAAISIGEDSRITVLKELHFPHSLGLLYSAFTYYCGFAVNSGEYKLMGLAPYGNTDSERVQRFAGLIRAKLVDIRDDGSFLLQQEYFEYATGIRMVNEKKWNDLFGFKRRDPEEKIGQEYMDMALAVQQVTEEIVIKLAEEAKNLTGCENLCMAGGVALNGVAAGKLDRSGLYSNIFIQPAAGDAGGALGAAYAANYIYFKAERIVDEGGDDMKGCFLGPQYSDLDIIVVANKHKADYELVNSEEQLIKKVAQYIADGKVVGWMQGRMEFGPRALGARSILADARNPEMKNKLNHAIKFREGFRPFAPIVPVEYVSEYFDQEAASPYMMFVKHVRQEKREQLPSVTHRDHSARLQTVHNSTNPRLWKLLNEFKMLTGCAVMINTSFNIKDEPIVNTPYEAYNCFRNSGMDYLIAGNIIFSKSQKQV